MTTTQMTTGTYAVESFTSLVLRDDSGEGAVYIEQGSKEGLQVEASPELLRRIEVYVRNETLYIRLGGSWLERLADKMTTSFSRPKIIYHLRVKELQSVDLSCASILDIPSLKTKVLSLNLCGLTQATVEQLEADRLELKHSGAGKLEFNGSVRVQNVQLNGSGWYAAEQLLCEDASISISGSSRARIHAAHNLDVSIRGMGTVEYLGEPRLRQQVLGIGAAIRAA